MSYQAIVSKISVRPHPNADRLQLGICHGNQVIVGLDTVDGELGIYFGPDGQLSHDFCVSNKLYTQSAVLKLGLDDPLTYGFFSDKRRVRAQKFRGEKSDGYWTPLTSLSWTGYDMSLLKEGDTFTELNSYEVCQKYYTPATLRAMAGQKAGKPKARREVLFPEHVDTGQFRNMRSIPEHAVIYISEKLHGTSGRFGHVLETTDYPWWKRATARIFGFTPERREWKHLSGSRRVVLRDKTGPGFYGTTDFRDNVVAGLALRKGEALYFEIVGDVVIGSPIMAVHTVKDELKELKKQYGPTMAYRYGCVPGEHKMFVYRITQLNEDGHEIDLPWTLVQKRCAELGLATVPVLSRGIYESVPDVDVFATWKAAIEEATDGPSTLDARHIREGVVVRIESSEGIAFLKNKSFSFGVLEGYIKDSEEYIDLEEAS
jgi:hypothetical protein